MTSLSLLAVWHVWTTCNVNLILIWAVIYSCRGFPAKRDFAPAHDAFLISLGFNVALRWLYVVGWLSLEQSRIFFLCVINVCFTYNMYLLMTDYYYIEKNDIAALWGIWCIIVSGQVVTLLLRHCMTKMTTKMATRLTLRLLKSKNHSL